MELSADDAVSVGGSAGWLLTTKSQHRSQNRSAGAAVGQVEVETHRLSPLLEAESIHKKMRWGKKAENDHKKRNNRDFTQVISQPTSGCVCESSIKPLTTRVGLLISVYVCNQFYLQNVLCKCAPGLWLS